MATNQTEKFVNKIIKKSNLENCPFLRQWFYEKLKEACALPWKPARRGIPKGDPMPFPRGKVILALCEIVAEGFRLKQFAEAYKLNYGTVRNWKKDGLYARKVGELLFEFVNRYISEYQKLLRSQDNNEQVLVHLGELRRYSKFLWLIVHNHLRDLKFPDENVDEILRHREFYNIYALAQTRKKDPAEHQKVVDKYLDDEKELLNIVFKALTEDIEKGSRKNALAKTKNLQKRIIEELIPLWGWTLRSFTDSLYESKKK